VPGGAQRERTRAAVGASAVCGGRQLPHADLRAGFLRAARRTRARKTRVSIGHKDKGEAEKQAAVADAVRQAEASGRLRGGRRLGECRRAEEAARGREAATPGAAAGRGRRARNRSGAPTSPLQCAIGNPCVLRRPAPVRAAPER